MATELEAEVLEPRRRPGGDLLRDAPGAGERHLRDERVRREGLPDGRSVSGHDVDDARWEDPLGEVDQRPRGKRGLLGGLRDDGAPGGQCRRELPQHERDGKVPRGDRGDDPDRLGSDCAPTRQRRSRQVDMPQPPGLPCEVVHDVDRPRNFGYGFGQGLADLVRDEPGDLCGVRVEEAGVAGEVVGSLQRSRDTPGREGAVRRTYGMIDRGGVTGGDLADQPVVARCAHRKEGVGLMTDPSDDEGADEPVAQGRCRLRFDPRVTSRTRHAGSYPGMSWMS